MISSGVSLLSTFGEFGKRASRPDRIDLDACPPHKVAAKALAAALIFDQKEHPVPAHVKVIGDRSDPGNIVGNCDPAAPEPRKGRQVSGGSKVRTMIPPPPDLEVDAEKRVKHFRAVLLFRDSHLEDTGSLCADAVGIDPRDPIVAKPRNDLVRTAHLDLRETG